MEEIKNHYDPRDLDKIKENQQIDAQDYARKLQNIEKQEALLKGDDLETADLPEDAKVEDTPWKSSSKIKWN